MTERHGVCQTCLWKARRGLRGSFPECARNVGAVGVVEKSSSFGKKRTIQRALDGSAKSWQRGVEWKWLKVWLVLVWAGASLVASATLTDVWYVERDCHDFYNSTAPPAGSAFFSPYFVYIRTIIC